MVKQRVHVMESGWDFIAQVRCVTLQIGFKIIIVHKSTVVHEHPFDHKRSRMDIKREDMAQMYRRPHSIHRTELVMKLEVSIGPSTRVESHSL